MKVKKINIKKRCVFCRKVLDSKGRCQNKKCPDYIRTRILEEEDRQKEAEQNPPVEEPSK